MLEHLVEIARTSTGASLAEFVMLEEPDVPVRLVSHSNDQTQKIIVRATPSGVESAMIHDATSSNLVQTWVGSAAIVSIVGPSGSLGWLAVAHEDAHGIYATAPELLERMGTLIEERLDRAAESSRMRALAEALRINQEELHDIRDQLKVSNRELEQFAYIAAHELVAPLRAVALYAEVLQTLVPTEPSESGMRTKRCATEIRSGVALMDRQVRYLLQLSSMERDTASPAPVDLGRVVHAAVDSLMSPLDDADATVEILDLPIVSGRPVPLQSVFANLIGNAVRYRDPSRPLKITISAARREGSWRLMVSDNGKGVSVEDQARIFQLFERADSVAPGSGIGLSVSRRIVESFGATIGVEPRDPHGSVFWIDFPDMVTVPLAAAQQLEQAAK